jgi:hypothetical protein
MSETRIKTIKNKVKINSRLRPIPTSLGLTDVERRQFLDQTYLLAQNDGRAADYGLHGVSSLICLDRRARLPHLNCKVEEV